MHSLMQKIFVLLLVLLFSGVVKADDKMRIAVLTLEPENVSDNTAKMVSDLLRTELLNTGLFRVLERGEMDAILKEQAFQQSGCTETACAVKIGKLLSANKMLIGTVGKLGEKFVISGRIVDVEKGELEFSDDVQVYSEGALIDAAKELATRLAGRIKGDIKTGFRTTKDKNTEKKEISQGDIYGQIIKTNGNKCVIDIGSTSGVAKGQQFQIMDPIEKEYIDKITGEKTTALEGYETIGIFNIIDVQPNDAQGELKNTNPDKELMGKQIQYTGIPLFELSVKAFYPLISGPSMSSGNENNPIIQGFNLDLKMGQREQGGNWVLRFNYDKIPASEQSITQGNDIITSGDNNTGTGYYEEQQYEIKTYSLSAGYFYKPFSKAWSFIYLGILVGYEYSINEMTDYKYYESWTSGNPAPNSRGLYYTPINRIIDQPIKTTSSGGIINTLVFGISLPPIPSWPVVVECELNLINNFFINNGNFFKSPVTGNSMINPPVLEITSGISVRI